MLRWGAIAGVWLCLFLSPGIASATEVEAAARPDDTIQQLTYDTLARRAGQWYDARRQTWRRVEAPEPSEPSNLNPNVNQSSWLNNFFTILVVSLVAAMVAAVALAILQRRELLGAAGDGAPDGVNREAALVAPRFLDLDLDEVDRGDLLAALAAARRAKDWDKAIICAYAAGLVLLDRAGLIQLRAGATNRMLQRELAADAQRSPLLAGLVERFERVYFGGETADADLVAAQIIDLEGLRTEVPRRQALQPRAAAGLFILAALSLGGCGDPEIGSTDFGASGGINGHEVLRASLAARLSLLNSPGVGAHLDAMDVVVAIDDGRGMHQQAFWRWAEDWLGRPHRRLLVVFHDVGTLPPLAQRWTAETRAAATLSSDDRRRQSLENAAQRLQRWTIEHSSGPRPEQTNTYGPVSIRGIAIAAPTTLYGRGAFAARPEVPELMRHAQVLGPGSHEWDTQLASESGVIVAVKPYPDGSQLIAVVGGSWLCDAALVDPAAQVLLSGLVDTVVTDRSRRAVWLRRAEVTDQEFAGVPGIAQLLGHPTALWVLLHVAAAIAAWLLWHACWIGRRQNPQDRARLAFHRHIDSVARLIDRNGGSYTALRQLAAWFGRSAPEDNGRPLSTARAWFPESAPVQPAVSDQTQPPSVAAPDKDVP